MGAKAGDWGAKPPDVAGGCCVLLSALFYSVYFSAFSLATHGEYQTQRYDLSFYAQALWNTLHGDFLRVTIQPGAENYLQFHFAPGLLLFVPLYVNLAGA